MRESDIATKEALGRLRKELDAKGVAQSQLKAALKDAKAARRTLVKHAMLPLAAAVKFAKKQQQQQQQLASSSSGSRNLLSDRAEEVDEGYGGSNGDDDEDEEEEEMMAGVGGEIRVLSSLPAFQSAPMCSFLSTRPAPNGCAQGPLQDLRAGKRP